MLTRVYIANLKSENFDWELAGTPHPPSFPDYDESVFDSDLFWDIIREKDSNGEEKHRKTDWGCWCLKLSKSEIIYFLQREKYIYNDSAKTLLEIAKNLQDDKEYLLVALEDIIAPPWD